MPKPIHKEYSLDNRDLNSTVVEVKTGKGSTRVEVAPAVLFANALANWNEDGLRVLNLALDRFVGDDLVGSEVAKELQELLIEAQLDIHF